MKENNIEWIFSKKLVKFEDSLRFMEEKVEKIAKKEEKSAIWLLEHEPVYTAGVSAKDCDLLVKTEIPVIKTNRGGKYTYHGPKMLIAYLMLDLKDFFAPKSPDIAKFVEFIELWVINFLAKFNIEGFIRKGRVGIWVIENGQEKKIGAIGIKVKKWVTYHGLAINIDPDLSAFNNIVPCGISEFGVTSLKQLGVNCDNFQEILQQSFFEEFARQKSQ
jgi:lipoyl(octanoyl) transferase